MTRQKKIKDDEGTQLIVQVYFQNNIAKGIKTKNPLVRVGFVVPPVPTLRENQGHIRYYFFNKISESISGF